ncbi:MAG: hypothetical protein AABX72_00305 [Nanoarchaeota archaeon]
MKHLPFFDKGYTWDMDDLDCKVLLFVKNHTNGAADSIEISNKLGSLAKERAHNLAGQDLLHERGNLRLSIFSILPKGERMLLPRWKRFMIEFFEQNWWELLKWVLSFIAGGGALAYVKWLLDKIP